MSENTSPEDDWRKEEPIGPVKCMSADCEKDRHLFRRSRYGDESCRSERCVKCGAERVDWARVEKKDLSDAKYTIHSLNYENVRFYYWHASIDEYAVNHARRKGLEALQSWANKRIVDSIGAPSADLYRDGSQTPTHGRVVYYAQHATASCCRKCTDEWHSIDRERPLRNAEIDYLTELVMIYVRNRLPQLGQQPERIPYAHRA